MFRYSVYKKLNMWRRWMARRYVKDYKGLQEFSSLTTASCPPEAANNNGVQPSESFEST